MTLVEFSQTALFQGFATAVAVLFFSSVLLGFVAWVKGILG